MNCLSLYAEGGAAMLFAMNELGRIWNLFGVRGMARR